MSSKPFNAIIDKVKEVFQDDDNIPASIKKLDFLKCRKKEIIVYKQLLFLFLRRKGYTLEKIGTALNTKHCTVIYGIKHINNLMEIKDEEVIFTYKKLEYELQAYF
jgi:chromosomal replication initiation ATPase DnaA